MQWLEQKENYKTMNV